MRQQVSSLLACGPARPIDPLDHHPLEPRKKYCSTKNTGKPQLAAIVHYNSLPSGRVNSDSEDKTKHDQHLTKSSQVATKAAKEVGDSRVEQRNGSAPSASASASASTTATACEPMSKTKKIKFGRLFFNRNKSNKHPDGLIDNLASSNEDESKLVEDIEMMESSPDLAHESSASGQLTSKHKQQQQQQQQPVIEFKFDLIVEGDDESSLMSQQQPEGGAPTTDPVASILRPIRQRKLLDSVNELVESFVLDSMDVCLVSAGTRRLELFDKSKKTPRTSDQFDYLLQSAELSLNYAFQLLEATHTKSAEHQHQVANCSPLRADSHSIELEAVLFVEKCSSPIEALDLLSAAKSTKETSNSDLATGQMTSQDCGSIEEALRVIDSVRARASLELAHCHNYTSEHKQSLVLMLNLKLKQQVNGGSFTNRMCMLDVSEPGGSRLKSILESIFSGQALAYLKRQKLHLKALEVSQLQQQQQQQQQVTTTTNMKHHHQIASLTRLIRAEWLIYKQLSSALIKSLVICHCHRLAPESAQDSTQQEEHVDRHLRHNVESRLMDYNLHLLGFARRLQRASWSRLKRRKRHLRRSHLAASNLSLVSDTNLSLGGESTSTQEDTSHMAQYHHDLMISSPFRQRTFLLPDALSRHPRTTQALDARLLDCYSSSHRNNHMRHHHHHHHHHHTRHNYNNHRQHPETKLGLRQVCQPLRPSGGAAASLHRRSSDRHLVVSDDLEAAESSSHASSSPSTSSAVNGRNLLLERCIIGQHVGEDLDDSIASGSLISSNSNSRLGGTRRAGRHLVNSRPERTIQQQLLHLEGCPSDSNTIDDSIEMQSLTSSITLQQQQQYQSTHSDHLEMLQHENSNNEDICSTVAEPPKQLKLEEFLNKLSTFIGPANGNLEETIRPDESTLRDTTNMEEEDEDCKSHSSILEHLSSLTLESNRKMVRQHQQQQLSAGCERVSIVTDERNQVSPLDGHLQHLLKSTLRFQQERQQAKLQQPNLAEQLRALTIDCCDGALPSQQRQNGPPSGPLGANSHETPPTSTESSSCCSSTSSASCSSSSAPPGKGKCQTNRTLDQLYASVMRRQKQAEETHAIQSP